MIYLYTMTKGSLLVLYEKCRQESTFGYASRKRGETSQNREIQAFEKWGAGAAMGAAGVDAPPTSSLSLPNPTAGGRIQGLFKSMNQVRILSHSCHSFPFPQCLMSHPLPTTVPGWPRSQGGVGGSRAATDLLHLDCTGSQAQLGMTPAAVTIGGSPSLNLVPGDRAWRESPPGSGFSSSLAQARQEWLWCWSLGKPRTVGTAAVESGGGKGICCQAQRRSGGRLRGTLTCLRNLKIVLGYYPYTLVQNGGAITPRHPRSICPCLLVFKTAGLFLYSNILKVCKENNVVKNDVEEASINISVMVLQRHQVRYLYHMNLMKCFAVQW